MGGASVLAETAPDATSALHSFAWSVLNRLQTLVEPRSMKSALAGAGATLPRPPSRPPSEGLRLRNAAEPGEFEARPGAARLQLPISEEHVADSSSLTEDLSGMTISLSSEQTEEVLESGRGSGAKAHVLLTR